jgi:polyisoprenoid-binding protein YceI
MATPTTNPPPSGPSHRRRNALLAIAAVLILAAVAVGGYGLWYLFLRPAGPAAVAEAAPVFPTQTVAAATSLDGQWQVNTSLGSMSDYSASWVGYRVQEQLAGVGGNTAVGRTPLVSGSLTLSGSTVTAATITADLTGLRSDDPSRDGQLRRQAIQSDTYPTATFTLSQPIDLGSLPADGTVVTVTAYGNLTLHGVSRAVQISLQAERRGGIIAVTGSLSVNFADYNIQPPQSFAVLSVDDHGIMELHILFTHA